MPTLKNKVAVRVYLDPKSVTHLDEWAKMGDRSVSQVVRDLISERLLSDQSTSVKNKKFSDSLSAKIKKSPELLPEKFFNFDCDTPPSFRPLEFEVDPNLDREVANAPVFVTRALIEDFKTREDTGEGLPRISFPSGNVSVPWSKLVAILETCLNERDLSAFFYPVETRFELIGGDPGASLKWWLRKTERKDPKRVRSTSPESMAPAKKQFVVQ